MQNNPVELNPSVLKKLAVLQRTELTGHYIYKRIARLLPEENNRRVIEHLAADELEHTKTWKNYTRKDISPNWLSVWLYVILARLFGFTFGIKLMEQSEENAQRVYAELIGVIPEAEAVLADEEEHEEKLLGMLDEERLRYVGSVVLGLNDALVELTGALAGLTLALQNAQLIALTGLITGISASVSMAASEYLSTRSEDTAKHPGRAALYTGIAYIITVALLIAPYLVLENYFISLGITLAMAVLIIAAFNYYISVAKGENFRRHFTEMTIVSLGVALFSFVIGLLIRQWLGVEV